jgi:hypothetical protein
VTRVDAEISCYRLFFFFFTRLARRRVHWTLFYSSLVHWSGSSSSCWCHSLETLFSSLFRVERQVLSPERGLSITTLSFNSLSLFLTVSNFFHPTLFACLSLYITSSLTVRDPHHPFMQLTLTLSSRPVLLFFVSQGFDCPLVPLGFSFFPLEDRKAFYLFWETKVYTRHKIEEVDADTSSQFVWFQCFISRFSWNVVNKFFIWRHHFLQHPFPELDHFDREIH